MKKISSTLVDDLPFGVAHIDVSRIEFKTGDVVTFNAYGLPHQAEIRGVFPRGPGIAPLYGLSGGVKSLTSGRCIEESQLYDAYPSLLNVPAVVLGQVSDSEFMLALNTFDSGALAQGFSEINASLTEDLTGRADYLRGCLYEAVGMRDKSAEFFTQALEKGFSEAAERISSPKDDVQLVFSIGSSRPSVVVQCSRHQADEVVEFAKNHRLEHVCSLPFEGISSVEDAPEVLKLRFADRYRLPGFVREVSAGAFAPPQRLSKVNSPEFN